MDFFVNKAVHFFTLSFRRQGWRDTVIEKWKPRKKTEKRKTSRGILIGKGTGEKLSRSIKISFLAKNKVIVSSSTVYAEIHNEGLKGNAFGKYSFQMPKRKFMGKSKALDKETIKIIEKRINSIMK